ncbi:hypothetical protein E8F20_05765 [Pseudomonas sp. BN415]|uniref:hypothetical protein n=1 Tax=Pseudomonas sp. BN415 TaxID=2567889 RepID=UPI0024561346|nr:hypothetical protein [Pseudomonas sp. BN415]MDH4581382.1 hypothetical protein [Pseudomonas sp. BN415]
MSNVKDVLERAKFVGNAINEMDSYYKLNKINPVACKDRLRGFYGEQHGDWNKANEQAETAILLLNAIGRKRVGFANALKAEKAHPTPDGDDPLLA